MKSSGTLLRRRHDAARHEVELGLDEQRGKGGQRAAQQQQKRVGHADQPPVVPPRQVGRHIGHAQPRGLHAGHVQQQEHQRLRVRRRAHDAGVPERHVVRDLHRRGEREVGQDGGVVDQQEHAGARRSQQRDLDQRQREHRHVAPHRIDQAAQHGADDAGPEGEGSHGGPVVRSG
jgi:hypothetical protein